MQKKNGEKPVKDIKAITKTNETLSYERLCEVLNFHPETASFTWKANRASHLVGNRAGANNRGYTQIKIDGVVYKAHRLIWLYVHKRWPMGFLDHINGNPGDNRPENLREVGFVQNSQNRKTPNTNSSGYKGVSYCASRQQYEAGIRVNGRKKFLGRFTDPAKANDAYIAAAKEHYGEFARLA